MPPEWLDTSSAPPAGGMFSTFRTSARNHRLITGPTAFAICLVNAGSHLAISRLSAVSPFMVPQLVVCEFGAPAMPAPVLDTAPIWHTVLSFYENVISAAAS